MFKGSMILSSDPKFCFELSLTGNNKIISLDEDDEIIELSPINNSNVVKGTILLPPIEAGWKEIDGDEFGYFEVYSNYLCSPDVKDFITVLLGTIYTGFNVIIYCPEFYNTVDDSDLYVRILYRFFENVYGIHLGTSDMDLFNSNSILYPLHSIELYKFGIMDPYQFLILFGNLEIDNSIYLKLFDDINPYGNSYSEKKEYIDLLRKSIKNNKINRCALKSI